MRKTAMVLVLALASGTAFAEDSSVPDEKAPAVETEQRSPVWFGAFLTSTIVAVGGLSVYVYSFKAVNDEVDQIRVEDVTPAGGNITEQDCGNPNIHDRGGHFENACTWSNRSRIAFFTTVIAVPFAIVTGYFAFRSMPKKEKRSVALIPTVTPHSAGAMLDVTW